VNVAAAQHITCILFHHGSLSLDVTAAAGELLSVLRLRSHLIETLQLHLKLMSLAHLGKEDLPFIEDAL